MAHVPRQITAGPGRRAKHAFQDLPPSVKVHQPGDKGYHGPRTQFFTGKEGQEDLHRATRQANYDEQDRLHAESRLKSERTRGRILLGSLAGTTGVIAAGTPFARRNIRRQTESNQKRAQILNSAAVRKGAFHVADPGIRHVTGVKGVHDISGMPKGKPTFSNKVERLAVRHPDAVEAGLFGAAAVGTGVLYAGTAGPRRKLQRSQRDLRNAQARVRRRAAAQPVAKRAPKPTEYSPGQPLERYSAERRRRGVAAEAAAYGGAASAAGIGAVGLSNAKIAGTRIGQHTLNRAEARLRLAKHPAASPVRRMRRIGAVVGRHPGKTNVAIGGLYTAAAGLGSLSRMRAHEEEGISQGVGRIKAGEAYRRTQQNVLGKSLGWTLARGALLATDVDPKNPKLLRTLRFANQHAGKIALGAAGAGAVGGTVASGVASRNRVKQTKELRRLSGPPQARLRPTARGSVDKAFEPHRLANIVLHPRREKLGAALKQNWKEASIGAGGVVGGTAAGSRNTDHRKSTAAAAGGGAVAGQAAYYTTGFRAISRANRQKVKGQKEGHQGLSRAGQEKIWRAHRKEHGHSQGQPMTLDQQRNVFGKYPDKLPGWRAQRLASHMQRGKYALAINAGTTAAGAALAGGGYTALRAHRNSNAHVGKALYAREERLSPMRVLQFGAGAGLAAWGLGRSPIVGHALARGLRMAAGKNNQGAVTAMQYAIAAQGALRRGTAPAERSLRQVRRINDAINQVPSALRPELAATAGLLLAGHAGPLHTTSYRPVSMPVRPPAYGW
jgi:hypothetical protein